MPKAYRDAVIYNRRRDNAEAAAEAAEAEADRAEEVAAREARIERLKELAEGYEYLVWRYHREASLLAGARLAAQFFRPGDDR